MTLTPTAIRLRVVLPVCEPHRGAEEDGAVGALNEVRVAAGHLIVGGRVIQAPLSVFVFKQILTNKT